jgi:transcription antitermination factor NusG
MSRAWYAVYTAPRCEARVQTGLACAGFGAWFPYVKKKKIRRGVRVKVRHPVFSRYVFAAFDSHLDDWRGAIESIDGAIRVLDNNGKLVPVPAEFIEAMQRKELNGGFDEDKLPAKGEEFRVADGQFSGIIGRVVSATANGRIKLLLNFMHRAVTGEFSDMQLERI